MKRTEMEFLIILALSNVGRESTLSELADAALTACEKAGMEPPKILANNIFHDAVDEFGFTNEWEEETK